MSNLAVATNMAGLNAHRSLKVISERGQKASAKLSSGYKINSAADDAAGLAISEKMRGQIRGLAKAGQNVSNGMSLIQTAEGGLQEISEMLGRIRELSVQAANDTNMPADRAKIQNEISELVHEISETARKTTFNTIPLLTPQSEDASPLGDIASKITGKSDIVFAIDISGSMGGTIDHVVDNIKRFVDTIPSGSRVAVLLYSDVNITGETIKELDFTSDANKIKDYLDSIKMYDGGDPDESGLEAIFEATEKLASSPSVDKHIVFVTDASSHTAPPLSSHTINGINQLLKDKSIVLHAIGPTSGEGYDQIKKLTAGTGGETYDINDTLGGGNYRPLKDIFLQVGANERQNTTVILKDMRSEALGIAGISVETPEDAENALGAVDNALEKVIVRRTYFGAMQNRLEHTLNNLSVSEENLQSAESQIRDTDMAKEMMEFTKSNILSQAGMSMLAQANQQKNQVLSIIQ